MSDITAYNISRFRDWRVAISVIEVRDNMTNSRYECPSVELLDSYNVKSTIPDAGRKKRVAMLLQMVLDDAGIDAHVVRQTVGPQVTQFDVSLARGVHLRRITALEETMKKALATKSLRILLAPIPGKCMVGIQMPNESLAVVTASELMHGKAWKNSRQQIPLMLGRNINGKDVILDLAAAPNLLLAGATGGGLSSCINLLVASLLFKFTPEEMRLIMVDSQEHDFTAFARLPHLHIPVVNDTAQALIALRWTVGKVDKRLNLLAKAGVKNIAAFNNRKPSGDEVLDDDGNPIPDKLPFIVIVIGELADIMSVAKKKAETCFARIAAKSRTVGIHTIIATRHPDKKFLTGTILANYPVRIAFRVDSKVDLRMVIFQDGAEKLLGNGDMLFLPPGVGNIKRSQCGFISDDEIRRVVDSAAEKECDDN